MKKAFQIAVLTLLMGCGGALKNSWIDFRAYYNTYYNANESYRAALKQLADQPREINVNDPIRVFQPPLGSADQQFQDAIDKGAQILRKFPESRWIDETLELIGKSYYYRQEYYSAQQKFEEQYNVAETPEMRQRAVVWKSRALLDLQMYSEGVVFLEDQLSSLSGEWKPELRAKAEVLLAEHYVQLQQWDQVGQLLTQALPRLPKGALKARAHFLHGQILEIGEQYGAAAEAYGKVSANRPGFTLLYYANYKQAEALRKMGNLEQALAIFVKMSRDDKNVERLPELYYQIARTEEAMGNYEAARQIYEQVLRSTTYQVERETRADIYYRLGQMYTNNLNRYKLAAAYYDSSSSLRDRSEQGGALEESLNTNILAQAYGRYSELRNRISHLDSLLWLGNLPQARFDSVIAEIRRQRIRQLEEQAEDRRQDANVLTNVNTLESANRDSGTSGTYGFLNYQNSRLLTAARTQFRAVWGGRPLVDNWRRAEAIRDGDSRQDSSQEETVAEGNGSSPDQPHSPVELDLGEIPFTPEERKKTRDEIASAKFELGNLFLLTLQEQDSAAHYFRSVVEQHPGHALVPKALYSLYELYNSGGDQDQAEQWAARLRREHPDSPYTRRLDQRLEKNVPPGPAQKDSTDLKLSRQMKNILSSPAATDEIAKELRSLALANKGTPAAPLVHYESIKYYIRLARGRDSIRVKPPSSDSLATDSANTDGRVPRLEYRGAYWDTVRAVLNEHTRNFSSQPAAERVIKLSEALGKMEENRPPEALSTCRELGLEPKIKGGISQFLTNVELPEDLEGESPPGTIDYSFLITAEGTVEEFQRVSAKPGAGIEEAFARAIREHLEFIRMNLDRGMKRVRCKFSFPVSGQAER
ncbi:tetratricopeptide repeat protein [Halalkalibaculum sp. DA384]|uniref:type IX secretion system periplasmic lipoprotein PorW/SprE n=1 Tax=Halalkalibaculum sp. DA384 TaxID=3373606 RepID=UPI003754DA30